MKIVTLCIALAVIVTARRIALQLIDAKEAGKGHRLSDNEYIFRLGVKKDGTENI